MKNQNPIKIFIVEDNKAFALELQADLETTFEKKPIQVHSFITGETCMIKFKEVKPDVVILDYHLNSKFLDAADGIKVLDWIKKESPETSVLMLTGDDRIDIAIKSFKHGAFDYIVKTESKFKKINNSLNNLFKMMAVKSEAIIYKRFVITILVFIALFFGGIIILKIINPMAFGID